MADNKPKTDDAQKLAGTDITTTAAPAVPTPDIAARFGVAAGSEPPTSDQLAVVRAHQSVVVAAAEQIDQLPNGRHKSLALTALEEALMWANKAVFA